MRISRTAFENAVERVLEKISEMFRTQLNNMTIAVDTAVPEPAARDGSAARGRRCSDCLAVPLCPSARSDGTWEKMAADLIEQDLNVDAWAKNDHLGNGKRTGLSGEDPGCNRGAWGEQFKIGNVSWSFRGAGFPSWSLGTSKPGKNSGG